MCSETVERSVGAGAGRALSGSVASGVFARTHRDLGNRRRVTRVNHQLLLQSSPRWRDDSISSDGSPPPFAHLQTCVPGAGRDPQCVAMAFGVIADTSSGLGEIGKSILNSSTYEGAPLDGIN